MSLSVLGLSNKELLLVRCVSGCFSSVSSAARAGWLLQRGGCAEGTALGVQHPGEFRKPPAALGCCWRGFPPAVRTVAVRLISCHAANEMFERAP